MHERVKCSFNFTPSDIDITAISFSGAFLIPYAISLICIGVPIFFLELSIGQRLRKGPLGVWNTISPYFSGLGLSSVVVSFLVGVYYNMLVAWCLYYFFISFTKTPPFVECPKKNGVVVEECRKAGATSFYWYVIIFAIYEK